MFRIFKYASVAFLVIVGSLAKPARADWPAKLFAPYAFITQDNGQLLRYYQTTGQKYFTLAFMNSRDGQAEWDGNYLITTDFMADQIAAIRAVGGDVIVSFGGAGGGRGSEPGMAVHDAVKLQALYQSIVDKYKIMWLDQDIEGGATKDQAVNHTRNTALTAVQKANPGLMVDFTLAADPDGIEPASVLALKDAKAQGMKISIVNVMTMDYGGKFDVRGENMGQLAVDTAKKSYEQCQAIDPDIKIGITSDIGRNDEAGEFYTIPDAQITLKFAQETPWVTLVAYWEEGRDSAPGATGQQGGFGPGARRGGGAPATRAGAPATRRGGGRRGGGFGGAATQPGGAFAAGGGPATRRGGGGGRRGATTLPANVATAGTGIPPGPAFGYTDVFKSFTTGFTPAKPQ